MATISSVGTYIDTALADLSSLAIINDNTDTTQNIKTILTGIKSDLTKLKSDINDQKTVIENKRDRLGI